MRARRLIHSLHPLLVLFALTACGGGAGSATPMLPPVTPVTPPPVAPVAGSVALSAGSYSVMQDAGALVVSVARSGGSDGVVSMGYRTDNDSATAGSDYTASSGTLSWANGEAGSKSFSVPVSNAAPFTGTRSFTIRIAGISAGLTVGPPSSAVVTINGSRINSGPIGAAGASRLLVQGSFGATPSSLDAAAAQTYDQWFAAQAQATPSLTFPGIQDATDNRNWLPFWWKNAVLGPDQLRQRMAFALSQIFVVTSQSSALFANNRALSLYYDLLNQNALGNYRQLLERVTLSLQMGVFLNMYHSDKPNETTGIHADQNYAREIMQLFTVGLMELNRDGTPKLDSNGRQIPTYAYPQIEALANTFTGFASSPTTQTGENAYLYDFDFTKLMVGYENHHDTSAKTLISGAQVPAGGTTAGDLKIALDTLFNHPNTAPFISRQLIQRLVNSNPSPGYVQRVATVFANNGSGVRGDLLAVARAILTDPEAVNAGGNNDGKLREPLLRLSNLWRAFAGSNADGSVNEYGITQNAYALTGQAPLSAATVFNFYQPDYVRAGRLAAAGLETPEFQISNENTLVLTINTYSRLNYQFVDSSGARYAGNQGYDESNSLGAESVLLHTAAWESLATDPAALVERMNQLLMQGLMPDAMRTTLVNYASAIPTSEATYRARRVVETADLLFNSPQYAVQR